MMQLTLLEQMLAQELGLHQYHFPLNDGTDIIVLLPQPFLTEHAERISEQLMLMAKDDE